MLKIDIAFENFSGLNAFTGKEIVSDVSMIIRHERYTGYGSYDHDITLIKLKKPVVYGQLIKPACLPAPMKQEKDGQMCYITGWGRLGEYKQVSKVLQEAKVIPSIEIQFFY